MKAGRVLFFVCFALLILALGCAGNFNSTSQAPNPGTGTAPPVVPVGAPTPTPSATPTPTPGATPTPTPAPTPRPAPSPTGFLYAIENPNAAAMVEAFGISGNGSLAPISTISAGTFATEIVANSKFVFVGDSQHRPTPIQLTSYSIGSSGALTMADQVTFSNNDDTMTGFLLDSTGAHLYAGSEFAVINGRISTYDIGASGHMILQSPDNNIGRPVGHLAMSPNGFFVYVAVFPQHHTAEFPGIRLLLRDPATGTLTDSGRQFPTTCCDQYTDLAPALGGAYLIGVQNNGISVPNNNKVTVFAVNPATGDLTKASELRGDFSDITVDRTGNFAILTNTTGIVTSYRINADGTLAPMGNATAIAGVDNVVVDAGNKFVYVQSSTAAQIFAFTFDESAGALGNVPGSPFTTSGVPVRMAAVGK